VAEFQCLQLKRGTIDLAVGLKNVPGPNPEPQSGGAVEWCKKAIDAALAVPEF
jgi:hypothetical protein